LATLPEINIESEKKFEYAKNKKKACFYNKKIKNFLILHVEGQKFNTILVSSFTLEEKIVYHSTF